MAEHEVYLEKLSYFSRMLRLHGLTVIPKETADAATILTQLGFAAVLQTLPDLQDDVPGDQGGGQPAVVHGTEGRLNVLVPERRQGRTPVGEDRHAVGALQQEDQCQQGGNHFQLFHPMLSSR
jgi:hypothetical protein